MGGPGGPGSGDSSSGASASGASASAESGLEVGRVVRPHGLRGQVVVELWTNRVERMTEGSRLSAGERELRVVRCGPASPSGGWARWLVTFEGVESREAAEALRDTVLRGAPIDDPEALWVHELIGAELVEPSGQPIGIVAAVEANPASDLLVLEDGRLIPLHFVTPEPEATRSRSGRRLVVDGPPGLLDG